MPTTRTILSLVAVSTLSTLLGACAGAGTTAAPDQRSPADPWEPLNRQVHAFNTTLDDYTLKPVARGYRKATPKLLRQGVGNFYDNLTTPWTAVNNFLQGKGKAGFVDLGRFVMNSSVGLGGLIDVGREFGLEPHDEDFGQTLAAWGVGDCPYVVVPFFGPRTLRDALTMPVNVLAHPLTHYENTSVRDKLAALDAIDARTRLLNAERLLSDSADPYITIRESYLQNREYDVYDGDPPVDDDFYDDFLDE